MCPEEEMVRPDAGGRIAAVANTGRALRDRTVMQNPRKAMRTCRWIVDSNDSVPVTVLAADPEPALRFHVAGNRPEPVHPAPETVLGHRSRFFLCELRHSHLRRLDVENHSHRPSVLVPS